MMVMDWQIAMIRIVPESVVAPPRLPVQIITEMKLPVWQMAVDGTAGSKAVGKER